jgi:hypothetical protein
MALLAEPQKAIALRNFGYGVSDHFGFNQTGVLFLEEIQQN